MFHNWLSDKDFIWWPFSFLRPEPDQPITFPLLLMMTGCFGGLAFVMFTTFAVMNNMFTVDTMLANFLTSIVGFFVWFTLVTRTFWNRRTRELQKKK